MGRRKKLIEWAEWQFADVKMTCDLCQMAQRDTGKTVCPGLAEFGRCPEGRIPYLEPENVPVWQIICAALPGFIVADGGYNYGAIEATFNIYGIEQSKRPYLMSRFLAIIPVIDAERERRRKQNAS